MASASKSFRLPFPESGNRRFQGEPTTISHDVLH
jgi:hypothetical protein